MRASCLAFCNGCCKGGLLEQESRRGKRVGSQRPATASGCGGAGPSAASALLSDAQRHRRRRASFHPAPRRSQRRLTPFVSSLLALERPRTGGEKETFMKRLGLFLILSSLAMA